MRPGEYITAGGRPFRDRSMAGRQLAEKLGIFAGRRDAIVLGLARGGLPVAYEVAAQLRLPLDVFVVRKLGVPGFGELAMGALASGGVRVVNEEVLQQLQPRGEMILEAVTAKEAAELHLRERRYRDGRAPLEVRGRVAILVDDGLATGASMRAAAAALRQQEAAQIVVAVPVGAPETCRAMAAEVDEVVCVIAPESFQAVGQYYEDFSQVSDKEVRELLAVAARLRGQNYRLSERGDSAN